MILNEGAVFAAFTVTAPLQALVLHFCYWIGMVEAGNDLVKQAKIKHTVKWIAIVYVVLWLLSSILWYTDTHSQGYDFFLKPLN